MSDTKPDDPPPAKPANNPDPMKEMLDQLDKAGIDDNLNATLKGIIKQNAELIDNNKKSTQIIEEMNTREQLKLRDEAVKILLDTMKEKSPKLAEKFKDVKDIQRLQDTIDLRNSMDEEFKDLATTKEEQEKIDADTAKIPLYQDPITKEFVYKT